MYTTEYSKRRAIKNTLLYISPNRLQLKSPRRYRVYYGTPVRTLMVLLLTQATHNGYNTIRNTITTHTFNIYNFRTQFSR